MSACLGNGTYWYNCFACMCIYINICSLHVCLEGQNRASGSLELKLQIVLSCLMWVIGTGLGSFGRITSAFNSSLQPLRLLLRREKVGVTYKGF